MVRLGIYIGVFVCEYAQFLHRADRYSRQALAFVYVLNEYRSLLVARLYAVGYYGRYGALGHDDGVDKSLALELGYERHVVVHVHKIYSPQRFWRQLGRDKKIFVIHGVGLDKLGPYAVYKFILDDWHYLSFAERQLLNHAACLLASECRVEEYEAARAGDTVVSRYDTDECVVAAGQGLNVEYAVGEPSAAAV